MKLDNTFTVPVPADEAWKAMLDYGRLAQCMPGATVDEIRGDDVTGQVRVKLGPIGITYQGKVTVTEKDESGRRVVLVAAGRELRGSGTASAQVTAVLRDVGGSTEVTVATDLNITGKPAQFGRGVMADVSERLIGQFAANLARELQGTSSAPSAASASAASASAASSVASAPSAAAAPAAPAAAGAGSLDLLGVAGIPVLKRLAPVLAALLALVIGVAATRRVMKGRSLWPKHRTASRSASTTASAR
jgi:uncharacterized protein